MNKPDLTVDLAGLVLKNPVMPASGCFGYGREYAQYYALETLGAVVVKATTLEPWLGNATPRVTEVRGGMLNAIGLANPGLQKVVQEELVWLSTQNVPIIVNVAGRTEDEYCQVSEAIANCELAHAVELNVSCPNVKCGGISFGVDPHVLQDLVQMVKRVCALPLFVKLSPNVTSIGDMAQAAEQGGADGISLINTLIGMEINIHRRKPVLANGIGGLSGPGIKPVAVRMVYQAAKVVSIPIIGMGGIFTGADAIEFMMAGATAVMVGTANFTDPYACPTIIDQIKEFMVDNAITSLAEIRGCVL